MSEITLKIQGKKYTIEEARQLYLELKELFQRQEYLPYTPLPDLYPYPYPSPAPIPSPILPASPWYITSTDKTE